MNQTNKVIMIRPMELKWYANKLIRSYMYMAASDVD